jgi:hypothetical protein
MKAFIVDRYGRKQSLRFGEMPSPELAKQFGAIERFTEGIQQSKPRMLGKRSMQCSSST